MLQGIICYYHIDNGKYLRSEFIDLKGTLKEAITQAMEAAKIGKCYKQVFIIDTELKRNVFYKANFK